MAYGVKWDPNSYRHDPDECREDAEQKATRIYGDGIGFLYRFNDVSYSNCDEYGDPIGSTECVELNAYVIVRKTPCGHTIKAGSRNRFVSELTTKQFACVNIDLALRSFIARKTRQAQIHESRSKRARRMIEAVTGKAILPTFARA